MPRFPSPGSSRVEFPGFLGTIKALRLPADPLAALRCLRLAIPREHAHFAPAVAACGRRRAWGWSPGIPFRVCFRGDDRISQVPGEPPFPFAHVLRPRPADASLTITERSRGPRAGKYEGADDNRLSRLNSMAFGLAAYVSRCWLPVTAQGWLPGAGQALLDGLPPAGFLQKVFNSLHCALASFSKLLGTIPVSDPGNKKFNSRLVAPTY
jgi:hypothetical protein